MQTIISLPLQESLRNAGCIENGEHRHRTEFYWPIALGCCEERWEWLMMLACLR